jgi:hypothetical protein
MPFRENSGGDRRNVNLALLAYTEHSGLGNGDKGTALSCRPILSVLLDSLDRTHTDLCAIWCSFRHPQSVHPPSSRAKLVSESVADPKHVNTNCLPAKALTIISSEWTLKQSWRTSTQRFAGWRKCGRYLPVIQHRLNVMWIPQGDRG